MAGLVANGGRLPLVEEAVLRAQIGDEQAMAAQLGYLLTAGALPQVSLGAIPADTSNRCHWPIETFHVYDDWFVSVELTSAEVNITEPAEIACTCRRLNNRGAWPCTGPTRAPSSRVPSTCSTRAGREGPGRVGARGHTGGQSMFQHRANSLAGMGFERAAARRVEGRRPHDVAEIAELSSSVASSY
jgi:hypothetical protein